jgi:hypothetical protein
MEDGRVFHVSAWNRSRGCFPTGKARNRVAPQDADTENTRTRKGWNVCPSLSVLSVARIFIRDPSGTSRTFFWDVYFARSCAWYR